MSFVSRTAPKIGLLLALLAMSAGCGGGARRRAGEGLWVASPAHGVAVAAGDVAAGCHASNVIVGSQVEPFLAASPRDPRFLAGAWQQDRFNGEGASAIAVAVSQDSGRTWTARRIPYITGCDNAAYTSVSDPQVGIGTDGRIYVSTIAVGPPGQAILVSSSADDGRTWSHPAVVRSVSDGSAILDKPALLVDRYRSGIEYEIWVEYPRQAGQSLSSLRVDGAFLSVSRDKGRTWSAPQRVYDSNTENQNHVPLELADGTLVDVFAEAYRLSLPASTEQIRVTRSTDEGRSWSAPVTAAQFPFSVVTAGSNGHPVRASGQDVSAFAQGKSVYVTWEYNYPGGSEIGAARSSDEGRTWTRLRDPANGPVIAFLPEIAADAHGDLGVSWYNAEASAGDPTVVEFSELDPGTTSWDTQAVIGPFSLDQATPSPEGYFLGDYEGLTPAGCGFRIFSSIAGAHGTETATTRLCPRRPGQ